MSFFEIANHAEAALWIVIGLVFAVLCVRGPRDRRSRFAIAACAFIAFGVSDLVEARTGAWWDPWWLLAWKAACVLVLLGLLVETVRRRGR